MLVAVQKQRKEGVDRKQETPPEQRTFLAGPKRGKFIEGRERTVAVRRDVSHREIVGEEEVFEARYRQGDENENRHARVARALGKQRAPRENARNARTECVNRREKREQQHKRAKNIHHSP